MEYAKASPDDILIRITIHNRASEAAKLDLLPTLWFRNTWSWENGYEHDLPKPSLSLVNPRQIVAEHATLGRFRFEAEAAPGARPRGSLPKTKRTLHANPGPPPVRRLAKDAFHQRVVQGSWMPSIPAARDQVRTWYALEIPAQKQCHRSPAVDRGWNSGAGAILCGL